MILAAILNYKQSHSNIQELVPKGVVEWLEIDKQGIGAACNIGLYTAFEVLEYDYCLLLANDIQEPHNSLETRLHSFKTHNAGIVTIPTEPRPHPTFHKYLAGNFMIHRKVWEKIGYFTTKYDHTYGPTDLNYTVRATQAGFSCVNARAYAKHLDNGDTAYGFSKKEALKPNWKEFKDWERNLTKDNIYLPVNQ